MSRSWIRYCKLVVQAESGEDTAIDLSDFRIRFDISQAVVGRPSTATITVYNVATETINKIDTPVFENISSKHLKVLLSAGYQDNYGMIFKGDLWWKGAGRESVTDTYMRLIAASGDRVHQHSLISKAFKSGTSQQNLLDSVCGTFNDWGVNTSADSKPTLSEAKYLRGRTVYSNAPMIMNEIADSNYFAWGYDENGELRMLDKDMTQGDQEVAIELNQNTGLVGRPQITPEGVTCRCLLNPAIGLGTLVKLDSTDIQFQDYDTAYGAFLNNKSTATTHQLDYEGVYRVVARTIRGDTRGNEWYCDLVMFAVNGGKPLVRSAFTFLPN